MSNLRMNRSCDLKHLIVLIPLILEVRWCTTGPFDWPSIKPICLKKRTYRLEYMKFNKIDWLIRYLTLPLVGRSFSWPAHRLIEWRSERRVAIRPRSPRSWWLHPAKQYLGRSRITKWMKRSSKKSLWLNSNFWVRRAYLESRTFCTAIHHPKLTYLNGKKFISDLIKWTVSLKLSNIEDFHYL